MKEIQVRETRDTYFSLKEGSNYKIMLTYDRVEVVEFEQFKKIANVLNDSEQKFITINQRIVNKSTIIDISPTDEKTQQQKVELKSHPQEVLVDDGNGGFIKLSEITEECQ